MLDKAAWVDYRQQRDVLKAAFREEHERLRAGSHQEREVSWEKHMAELDELRNRFGITATAHTQITERRVSVFQESDDPDHDIGLSSWDVTVAYRGRGLWAVTHHSYCLNKNGGWDYEMRPSERDDDWLGEHRFPLDEAVRLAKQIAPHISINGRTAAELKIELFMKGKIP
jgi:hypothetical protein